MKLKAFINSKITGENKFEIPEITQEFGLNYLSKLQVGKATGLDGISARLLRAAAAAISSSLTKVINLSINTGKFLGCWKEATVCPVYKVGDRLSGDNHRPISILSILSKVLERHVYPSMYEHLTKHNLLSIHQSGFRPYHSRLNPRFPIIYTFFYLYFSSTTCHWTFPKVLSKFTLMIQHKLHLDVLLKR